MDWIDGLRAIKARTNLSTREIAEKSGLPEPTLEKLFSGQTKNPGINTVKQLVHALGYTLDDLDGIGIGTKKDPANRSVDEARERVITQLCQMSPEEFELVDAFVQGMRAKRQDR
jgi:transcriptional regulator with XRE-family HTH domain